MVEPFRAVQTKIGFAGGEKFSLITSKIIILSSFIDILNRIREFKSFKKINHFPASGELGNKEKLSINI